FSKKAIKRLLPLMRSGKYWYEKAIDKRTRERIEKIINGEADDSISERAREQAVKANLRNIDDFSSLPMYLASYVVYDRHSENADATKWHTPDDIDRFLKQFKQHSLHNPIVEQVILEALRTVRDIWRKTGDFDEIHVELGRDMKNTAEKRKSIMQKALENENTNLRIKALLTEFLNPDCGIENVRPQSPSQQEKLRIYEECVLSEEAGNIPDDIAAIIRNFNESDIKKRPSHSDVIRYKCWLEQKYRSPYTGRIIPLGKLFTPEYEIEHIIPQALYFDDSLSNKVICETAVNKDKGKRLAYNYIKECGGKIISLGENRNAEILKLDKYEELVKNGYPENKKKKLLATEIPDTFSERQLNDTRYISRFVMQLLSNIVRTTDENGNYEQESTSKNVIPCSGKITDMLKRQWGINDVWNRIIAPRFQRLNELHGDNSFGEWCNEEGKRFFRINVPFHLKRGFSTKRIDHRHHAMDAIIIACANRNIVNYLNNVEAKSENKRIDLRNLICHKETDSDGNYKFVINKPWTTFTEDVQSSINKMTVSFKNNIRIINRTKNRYQKFVNGRKQFVKQEKGDQWAIRKPLHKDSYYGLINVRKEKDVNLPIAVAKPEMIIDKQLKFVIKSLQAEGKDDKRIISILKNTYGDKVKKVRIYYFTNDSNEPLVAIRKPLDASFDRKKINTSVSDAGVRKILLNHLTANSDDPQIAFSPEGISRMNENIITLNDGKPHQPIYKVRYSEPLGLKFQIGTKGKFVEAAKGTNLYFAIYKSFSGERSYQTIPLNMVIERLKQGLPPVPEQDEKGNNLLFTLSPNDLVYVPTPDELESGIISEPIDNSRIYKMVSATEKRCYFIPAQIAYPIENGIEFNALNKLEFALTGESIKSICIPIKIDRLGNISLLTTKTL
ncbi:MAG: type II CRISPR RNA-guided endonuclease Cas9, partial [Bacteroidetes bacterium]|nr:type II CRISPR RNA-guided endonuclease Cas9 [Candidatus Limisoma faecipullorum]